jgi:hypothetical protein
LYFIRRQTPSEGIYICGPSSSEKSLAGQSSSLSSSLNADFGSRFADQSKLLSTLSSSLNPIVQNGPSQQGMSAAELANLNSSAINNSAAAARNARQAVGNFSAGQNGTSGLTSGITKQLDASVDSSAANSLATNENNINAANYAIGRDNYRGAVAGLQNVANGEDASGFAGSAISGNQNAFGQAKTITDQTNAEQQAIAGGIAGLATSALTFGAGGLGNMGEGSGIGDFFAGGIQGLGGKS